MTTTSAESPCSICSEALEPHTRTECNTCGLLFHLNQRTDLPGKDCGIVTLSDVYFGIIYTCDRCLSPVPEDTGTALDDIMTLEEAATFLATEERILSAAAQQGRIRHRKAGPVLLFERADLIGFRPTDEPS